MNFPTTSTACKHCPYCGLHHYAKSDDPQAAIRKAVRMVESCGKSRAAHFLNPERPDLQEPKR